MAEKVSQVAIVGAGPLGIELAIALKQSGISYLHFDKAQCGQSIYNFPIGTHFFSSSERIGLAGIPVQTIDQGKCSREQYLCYLRSLIQGFKLEINTFEEVVELTRKSEKFILATAHQGAEKQYEANFLILATGGTSQPRILNVPGENLEHVSVKMEEPHKYFQKKVLVVGGKNSAVESALRCNNAGASVAISTQKASFEEGTIKYWLLPDLLGRFERKEIQGFFQTKVKEIFKDRVLLESCSTQKKIELPVDFVIKAIGFHADMRLFQQIGASLNGPEQAPAFDPETMETSVKNAFALGTVTAGTQSKYRVFIENTHIHVEKIARTLCLRLNVPFKGVNTLQFPTRAIDKLEE